MLGMKDPMKFSLNVIVVVVGMIAIGTFYWVRYVNLQSEGILGLGGDFNYAQVGDGPMVYEDQFVRFEYPNYWISDRAMGEPYTLAMRGEEPVELGFSSECSGTVLHRGEVSDIALVVEAISLGRDVGCWEQEIVAREVEGEVIRFEWSDGTELLGDEIIMYGDGGRPDYVLAVLFDESKKDEALGVFREVSSSFNFK